MYDFLTQPIAQAVVWTTVAVIMAIIGWYYLKNLRDQHASNNSPNDHLLHFRDLKQQGVLDEGEFRTIKTVLGHQVQDGDESPNRNTPEKHNE